MLRRHLSKGTVHPLENQAWRALIHILLKDLGIVNNIVHGPETQIRGDARTEVGVVLALEGCPGGLIVRRDRCDERPREKISSSVLLRFGTALHTILRHYRFHHVKEPQL